MSLGYSQTLGNYARLIIKHPSYLQVIGTQNRPIYICVRKIYLSF
jgi:hypothetical protein